MQRFVNIRMNAWNSTVDTFNIGAMCSSLTPALCILQLFCLMIQLSCFFIVWEERQCDDAKLGIDESFDLLEEFIDFNPSRQMMPEAFVTCHRHAHRYLIFIGEVPYYISFLLCMGCFLQLRLVLRES